MRIHRCTSALVVQLFWDFWPPALHRVRHKVLTSLCSWFWTPWTGEDTWEKFNLFWINKVFGWMAAINTAQLQYPLLRSCKCFEIGERNLSAFTQVFLFDATFSFCCMTCQREILYFLLHYTHQTSVIIALFFKYFVHSFLKQFTPQAYAKTIQNWMMQLFSSFPFTWRSSLTTIPLATSPHGICW